MRATIGTVLVVMAVPLAGFAQTEVDREAEMFGDSESDSDRGDREEGVEGVVETGAGDAATVPQDRDTLILDGRSDEGQAIERLMAADDPLAVGGLVYLRGNYSVLDEGELGSSALTWPMLMDVFLDSRPSDAVRFYARGRMSGDLGDASSVGSKVDQLWLKFDLQQTAFVTVGRQRVKWGTGRFWNPTDFLNREALDPLSVSVFDERLGVSLVKVHVPLESLGANLYAFGTLEGVQAPAGLGGAFRAEWVLGTSEISTSFAARKDHPWRVGADFNGAVGPIDLKVEGALQYGVKTPFFRGEIDTSPLSFDEFELDGLAPTEVAAAVQAQLPQVLAARQAEAYTRDDEWLGQVVVGAEYGANYTEDDVVYVGAEYFFNESGYDGAELYPALFQSGTFRPFYAGRHYGAVYLALPAPGDWDDTNFTASSFGNFSDRSFLSRLDVSMNFATYLTFNAFVQGHFGASGEFNYSYSQPALLSADILARIPAENRAEIPPELTEGVEITGPRLSAGLGLRMPF